MENFLTLVMWVAFGMASAYFAKKQRRNPYLWFGIGLFLGIFGLLLLLMLPIFHRMKAGAMAKKAAPQTTTIDVDPTSAFSLASLLDASFTNTLWYYLDEANTQKGPMSFTAFERDWKEGKLASSSYIWNEKLPEWKQFQEIFPAVEGQN